MSWKYPILDIIYGLQTCARVYVHTCIRSTSINLSSIIIVYLASLIDTTCLTDTRQCDAQGVYGTIMQTYLGGVFQAGSITYTNFNGIVRDVSLVTIDSFSIGQGINGDIMAPSIG